MNSPSWISNEMPWMTFVLPNAFSMLWNDTDAIGYSACTMKGADSPASDRFTP